MKCPVVYVIVHPELSKLHGHIELAQVFGTHMHSMEDFIEGVLLLQHSTLGNMCGFHGLWNPLHTFSVEFSGVNWTLLEAGIHQFFSAVWREGQSVYFLKGKLLIRFPFGH